MLKREIFLIELYIDNMMYDISKKEKDKQFIHDLYQKYYRKKEKKKNNERE